MSIKFTCSCGKRLRARDEMAARRSVCPRCGNPVGIPSLQPTHPGTTADPMTPQERLRHQKQPLGPYHLFPAADDDDAPAADSSGIQTAPSPARGPAPAPRPLEPNIVRLRPKPKRASFRLGGRERRPLEARWYQCLDYPFRAWKLVLGLSLVMGILSTCLVGPLPLIVEEIRRQPAELWLLCFPYLLIPLLIVGYASGFLDGVITAGIEGDTRHIRWPGRNVLAALKSGLNWLVCFLAGPVFAVVGAYFYWLYSGEPGPLDWIILAELGLLAVGYWALCVVAVNESGSLLDANPLRVGELLYQVGYRLGATVFVASLLALGHAILAGFSLVELHNNPAAGAIGLMFSWFSGLFQATFFFRLIGVWCYRLRERAEVEAVDVPS